jgi:large subunit ribosomal protein L23
MEITQVIIKPILTEKSLNDAARGEYTFAVNVGASKSEISRAVKELFKVDVLAVSTRTTKGKSKRVFRSRIKATLGPVKKATVRVGKEQKIDIFEVKS